jgi:hypothetical protein
MYPAAAANTVEVVSCHTILDAVGFLRITLMDVLVASVPRNNEPTADVAVTSVI